MADSFRLRINLDKLAANLSAAESRTVTALEARTFLIEHDFLPVGNGWICEEVSLGLPDKSEVLSMDAAD